MASPQHVEPEVFATGPKTFANEPNQKSQLDDASSPREVDSTRVVSLSNGNLATNSDMPDTDEQLDQALVAGDNSLRTNVTFKETSSSTNALSSLPSAIKKLTLNSLHHLSGNLGFECNHSSSESNKLLQQRQPCCLHEHEFVGAGSGLGLDRKPLPLSLRVEGDLVGGGSSSPTTTTTTTAALHLVLAADVQPASDVEEEEETDENMGAVATIDRLPAETTWHILSFVSPKDLRSNVRAVCRQWRAIADDELLWKHLCQQELNITWIEEELRRTQYKWSEYFWQLLKYKDDFLASYFDEEKKELGCEHYKRNNKILAACCNRFYVCRHCHNADQDHAIDRYATSVMFCMVCRTIQPKGHDCRSAVCNGRQLAVYFCNICNFWDNCDDKSIFHCPDCNVCYLGRGLGIDYYHCYECNMCFDMRFAGTHRHIKKLDALPSSNNNSGSSSGPSPSPPPPPPPPGSSSSSSSDNHIPRGWSSTF